MIEMHSFLKYRQPSFDQLWSALSWLQVSATSTILSKKRRRWQWCSLPKSDSTSNPGPNSKEVCKILEKAQIIHQTTGTGVCNLGVPLKSKSSCLTARTKCSLAGICWFVIPITPNPPKSEATFWPRSFILICLANRRQSSAVSKSIVGLNFRWIPSARNKAQDTCRIKI